MDQLLRLGEALASMARIVAREEAILTTGVTIPQSKFSREDLEYLSVIVGINLLRSVRSMSILIGMNF